MAMRNIFFVVYNYAGKPGLGKSYWHPRRKVGVAMHFSETIKVQFEKKFHTLFCILTLFRLIAA